MQLRELKPLRLAVLAVAAVAIIAAAIMGTTTIIQAQQQQPPPPPSQPPYPSPKKEPPVITPGAKPGDAPSDAIILFDGKDLSGWKSLRDGGDAKWTVQDGFMQVKGGTGDIATKQEFGDCQLHIEWATPAEVKGDSQGRGNSGVFLMGHYEVQVLDSYQNPTYFHGQAGSVYKQHAPLVNAARKPGEWQTYDIIFSAPEFDEIGKVTKRARVTVIHNGVLVQNNVEIYGETWHDRAPSYIAHPSKGPLKLQDHGNPTRFRNVWVRPL
ncbi:MAG: DUF1080 domain-containing protein [Acidobacteriota bacterium]